MTRLRCAASLFLLGLVATTSACKPAPEPGPAVVGRGHLQEPPGFGHATPYYRKDAGNNYIIVDVAVGANAAIVDKSGKPPGGADVALAWISNTGGGDESKYHFKPNTAATYVLYWKATGGFRIEEDLTHGPPNPTWREGNFDVCDTHTSGPADVGFKDCGGGGGGGHASSTAMLKTSSMTGGLFSALFTRIYALYERAFGPPSPDSPGWASCSDGCCSWSAT